MKPKKRKKSFIAYSCYEKPVWTFYNDLNFCRRFIKTRKGAECAYKGCKINKYRITIEEV